MDSPKFHKDMSPASILIGVKEASSTITRLLQETSVMDFDQHQYLAFILESISEVLLSCNKPFEEDADIKGLLHVMAAVMSCQSHLVSVGSVVLAILTC